MIGNSIVLLCVETQIQQSFSIDSRTFSVFLTSSAKDMNSFHSFLGSQGARVEGAWSAHGRKGEKGLESIRKGGGKRDASGAPDTPNANKPLSLTLLDSNLYYRAKQYPTRTRHETD